MMTDSFTEVTSKSWFGRLRESITSVLIGIVLFLAAIGVLFWNEGRTVRRAKTLEAGRGMVITVGADSVDQGNDGKLVHMTGEALTDETLEDPDFGVSMKAIKLSRTAEMYQWEETKHTEKKKKVGGGEETITTYTYSKVWSERSLDSNGFHQSGYHNPIKRFESEEWRADKVTVGAFTLSPGLLSQMNDFSDLAVGDDDLKNVPAKLHGDLEVSQDRFYLGKNPGSPEIGDIRVSFEYVPPGTVSLVSEQVKNTFEPYQLETGSIELLETGTLSADAMFETAKKQNVLIGWLVRGGGFLAMLIGITMIFKPLVVAADVLPILGDMLGAGVFVFALIISLGLSLMTISAAWVFYRPIVGIPLVVVALGLMVGFFVLRRKK